MGVKLVILDLDGTLIHPSGRAQTGTVEMTAALKAAGLAIVVATNSRGEYQTKQLLRGLGYTFDFVEDHAFAGAQKGSPRWVTEICAYFHVERHEVLYLGDTDLDMRSAVNARVVYFHAAWSRAYEYGIQVARPALFSLIVTECFLNPSGWYWRLDTTDGRGRKVDIRALMDANGADIPEFKKDMLKSIKDGEDRQVGPMKFSHFIAYHLLGNIYADRLYEEVNTWAVYPSSTPTKTNTMLAEASHQLARLFRDKSVNVLRRHTQAPDSGRTRTAGGTVAFDNQLNTVSLVADHRTAIRGRSVVVLDDFMRDGYSLECARNLLFEGGASEVFGINFAKYSEFSSVFTPISDYSWDPFSELEHDTEAFWERRRHGQINSEALTALRGSYRRVAASR